MNTNRRAFTKFLAFFGTLTVPLGTLTTAFGQALSSADASKLISHAVESPDTTYGALQSLIQAFFGNERGNYIPRHLVDENYSGNELFNNDLLLNQFSAVYTSFLATEDKILPDGSRFVVRYAQADRGYTGLLFIDPATKNILAVGISYYVCPPNGYTTVLPNAKINIRCEGIPSVALFWRNNSDIQSIVKDVRKYYSGLYMPLEELIAKGSGKPLEIKIMTRQLQ